MGFHAIIYNYGSNDGDRVKVILIMMMMIDDNSNDNDDDDVCFDDCLTSQQHASVSRGW